MLVKGLDRVNDFALEHDFDLKAGVLGWMIFSASLCTLCASVVKMFAEELHHRDTEKTEFRTTGLQEHGDT